MTSTVKNSTAITTPFFKFPNLKKIVSEKKERPKTSKSSLPFKKHFNIGNIHKLDDKSLELASKIGEGTTAEVFLVRHKITKKLYALKKIKLKKRKKNYLDSKV